MLYNWVAQELAVLLLFCNHISKRTNFSILCQFSQEWYIEPGGKLKACDLYFFFLNDILAWYKLGLKRRNRALACTYTIDLQPWSGLHWLHVGSLDVVPWVCEVCLHDLFVCFSGLSRRKHDVWMIRESPLTPTWLHGSKFIAKEVLHQSGTQVWPRDVSLPIWTTPKIQHQHHRYIHTQI